MQREEAPPERAASDLARSTGVAALRIDEEGRILEFSPQAEALFGFSRDEMTGRCASLLAANAQDARLGALSRRARELGRAQHSRLDAKTKDGRPLYLSVTAAWIPDAPESPEGTGSTAVLAVDIASEREEYEKLKRNTLEIIRLNAEIRRQASARQAALDALEELSARLQGVLSAAWKVVIVATGPTGTITLFNSGAHNLLGFDEGEMVGAATPLAFFDRDELAARGQALARKGRPAPEGLAVLGELAISGVSGAGEWTLVRRDGTRFPAEVALSPIRGPEGVEGYLMVAVDISARRQAEEQLRLRATQLEEHRQAMEKDLRAAADIQRGLLPGRLPLDPRYRAHWLFEPSATIGGDIFNILPVGDNLLAVYILDVSGHGVSSALVASAAAQALMGLSQPGHRFQETPKPEAVLTTLDREFPLERFDRYFSLVYLILDLRDGHFTYCNAGHPPPLLVRARGGVEPLDVGGTVVGLGDIMPFERGQGRLEAGDTLVFYTDGVTEFENASGRTFGVARLRRFCQANAAKDPGTLMADLGRDIEHFGQGAKPQDDLSALALKRMAGL
ncbi:hypothetical protein JCM15519_18090 [Fundidesulfovibrio butyratiphilus]